MHEERTYRNLIRDSRFKTLNVIVEQTDLLVHAKEDLKDIARDLVIEQRGYLEAFIRQYPEFSTTLQPWSHAGIAPGIVADMLWAGELAAVGPMAAVAGALAERIGFGLLTKTDEIIVENGGDIFIKTNVPVTIGIFAGKSPLNMKFGFTVDSRENPVGVCTSSGSIGHSLSLGNADSVCVISASCSLADAAATSIGNRVRSKSDVQAAIEYGKSIDGVSAVVIIASDELGLWGDLELLPLSSIIS